MKMSFFFECKINIYQEDFGETIDEPFGSSKTQPANDPVDLLGGSAKDA